MSHKEGSFFLLKEVFLNYTPPDLIANFRECAFAVEAQGFFLVELQIIPQKGFVKTCAVIAPKDSQEVISVLDCAKVHSTLWPLILNLLQKNEDDVSMEICSPGIERTLKDAYEFKIFKGKAVRIWDKKKSDWVSGFIKNASDTSVLLETDEGEKTFDYYDIAKAKLMAGFKNDSLEFPKIDF